MREKIRACAKLLEITTEELFIRAYRVEGGRIFGLRTPEEVHERWERGICVEPIYVVSFVNKLVATVH